MPDEPKPVLLTLTDAYCMLVGLALGTAFGTLIHNLAAGIGTGVAMAVASNMMRRKGAQHWLGWLALYSVILLVACVLKLTGVLK